MGPIEGSILVIILAASLVVVIFRPTLLGALIEGINNFRGGPPTAMHPSPSDDGFLLRKRSRKIED